MKAWLVPKSPFDKMVILFPEKDGPMVAKNWEHLQQSNHKKNPNYKFVSTWQFFYTSALAR